MMLRKQRKRALYGFNVALRAEKIGRSRQKMDLRVAQHDKQRWGRASLFSIPVMLSGLLHHQILSKPDQFGFRRGGGLEEGNLKGLCSLGFPSSGRRHVLLTKLV